MKFNVHIIEGAEQDLFEIYNYVASAESPTKALELINQLESSCQKLETVPNRGRIPPESHKIGVEQYREIILKVYRIIYQVDNKNVFIHCVLDGRRDLQELLEQRLLR